MSGSAELVDGIASGRRARLGESVADRAIGLTTAAVVAVVRALRTVIRWHRRRHAFKVLRNLHDDTLTDIGLSRGTLREYARSLAER